MKTALLKPLLGLNFVLLLCYPIGLYSQSTTTVPEIVNRPSVILPSPQSQVFERYVNHAITEHSGTPDITIPLYEIELDGLKIPLALTYRASGIRYLEHDGDVGAGWAITAEGYRIMRMVIGRCDFNPFNLPKYSTDTLNSHFYGATLDAYLAKIHCIGGGCYHGFDSKDGLDGGYDLFTYTTPSTNGHFLVTGKTGTNNYTTTSLDGKLDKIESLGLTKGEITDSNGFKYYFGDNGHEFANDYIEITGGPILEEYVTAWTLKKLTSPYGRSIDFEYERYDYKSPRSHYYEKYSGSSFGTTFYTSLTAMDAPEIDYYSFLGPTNVREVFGNVVRSGLGPRYENTTPYLTKITGINETVEITRVARDGDLNTPNLISKIQIKDKIGTVIKEINFSYTELKSGPNITSNQYPWHIVLTSVKIGDGSIGVQEYNFDYYGPPSGTAYPDYWNYYTSGGSSNLQPFVPDLFKEDTFIITRGIFTTSSPTGFNSTPAKISSMVPGTGFFNRSASTKVDDSQSFSLKKITFPTGGYSEYEYEPNQYQHMSGHNQYSSVTGSGIRVKKIRSYDGINASPSLVTVFKYGLNEDGLGGSGKHMYESLFRDWDKKYIYQGDHNSIWFIGTVHIRTYRSSLARDEQYDGYAVHYPEVAVYQYDGAGNPVNGKIVSNYNGSGTFFMAKGRAPGLQPTLKSRKIYNTSNQLLQKEEYGYKRITPDIDTFLNVYVEQIVSFDESYNVGDNVHSIYNQVDYIYDYEEYPIVAGFDLPTSKRSVIYSGSDSLVTEESYRYNSRNQMDATIVTTSLGGNLEVEYVYPADNSFLVTRRNMYATVLQEITRESGEEIKRLRYNYPASSTRLPKPLSVDYSSTGANNLQTELSYRYDPNNGNLIEYKGRDNTAVTYVWGYNGKYPVAQIIGADSTTVFNKLNIAQRAILAKEKVSISEIKPIVDHLRTQLPTAQVTGYSYIPLVGVSAEIAPNGLLTYYKYDTFGRLRRIQDHNGKDIELFQYHHADQYDLNIGEIQEYVAPPPPPSKPTVYISASCDFVGMNCNVTVTASQPVASAVTVSLRGSGGLGRFTMTIPQGSSSVTRFFYVPGSDDIEIEEISPQSDNTYNYR